MENVSYLFNRIITARQYFLNTRLKPLGLTSSLFSFLVEVIQHKELSQKDLSRRLRVDPALTTRNIRKLIQLGYIQRQSDPRDKRANLVSLTDEGRRISEGLLDLNLEWFNIVASQIPRSELERTLNIFKKIIINVETQILGESLIDALPVRLPEEQ